MGPFSPRGSNQARDVTGYVHLSGREIWSLKDPNGKETAPFLPERRKWEQQFLRSETQGHVPLGLLVDQGPPSGDPDVHHHRAPF